MRLPIRLDLTPLYIVRMFFFVCLILGLCIILSLVLKAGPAILKAPSLAFGSVIYDDKIRTALNNTGILFLFAALIQAIIVFWGTLLVHKVPPWVKVLLVMPYAAGIVAPASSVYVLLSSSLGPLNTPLLGTVTGLRFVIAFLDSWQWAGILLLACFFKLERIPSSHFEQARLDGMSRLRTWRLLVLPKILGVVGVYFIVRALDWFRKVDLVRMFGRDGGPGYGVETFGMYITRNYYYNAMGESFASLLLLLQMILLGIALTLIFRFKLINLKGWLDDEE